MVAKSILDTLNTVEQTKKEQREVVTSVKGAALAAPKRKRVATKKKKGCSNYCIFNLPDAFRDEYKELRSIGEGEDKIMIHSAGFNQFAIDAVKNELKRLKRQHNKILNNK